MRYIASGSYININPFFGKYHFEYATSNIQNGTINFLFIALEQFIEVPDVVPGHNCCFFSSAYINSILKIEVFIELTEVVWGYIHLHKRIPRITYAVYNYAVVHFCVKKISKKSGWPRSI